MLASVVSATLLGVEGHLVTVEVHVSSGLPSYTVVGLPAGSYFVRASGNSPARSNSARTTNQTVVCRTSAKLGLDHIHHYDSDPQRDWNGLKHGFLILRVQVFLSGSNLYLEPLLNFRPRQRSVHSARST